MHVMNGMAFVQGRFYPPDARGCRGCYRLATKPQPNAVSHIHTTGVHEFFDRCRVKGNTPG